MTKGLALLRGRLLEEEEDPALTGAGRVIVLILGVFALGYLMAAKCGLVPWFWGPNKFACLKRQEAMNPVEEES